MAETNKAKFFRSNFQLENQGQVFELSGLVSDYGITKVSILSRPPPFIDTAFGHLIKIQIGDVAAEGLLVRNYTDLGTGYEVRFQELGEAQRIILRQRMELEGGFPEWVRKFPRISVKDALALDLPVFNMCFIRVLGGESFVSVLNFTLDGIRVEIIGDDLKDVRVGMVVHFDLLTNADISLENVSGEIRNMSVIEQEQDGERRVTRSIGIRLQPLEYVQKRKMDKLITNLCQAQAIQRPAKI